MDTSIPHPQRFEFFKLLPDGSSFTIKNCKYIFKIDQYGGWKDQYGHYYNANGEPDFQPEISALTPSEGSAESDYAGNQYEQYQPNYHDIDDHEQVNTSQQISTIQKISKNMEILSTYPLAKPLRVYFNIMTPKCSLPQLYQTYSKKVQGIHNIIYPIDNSNNEYHQGYFIMGDSKQAENLIKLQGERILEKQIYFNVEKLNQLIMNPITKQQFMNDLHRTQSKLTNINININCNQKYKPVPIQHTQQIKIIQSKQKTPQKLIKQGQPQIKLQQQTTVSPTIQKPHKPQQQPKSFPQHQFSVYILNFQIFDSPKKFYEWIGQYGYSKDTYIKKVLKQTKKDIIKITMEANNQMVKILNGKQYNGKKVSFIPV